MIERIIPQLNEGKLVRNLTLDSHESAVLKTLFLLTAKPILYVANVDESTIASENREGYAAELFNYAESEGNSALRLCGQIEMEIAEMDPADQQIFLEEYGLPEPGLNKLIHRADDLLNLKTFFTVNEKEVHAWHIPSDATAFEAAGAVHTDFQKGFIRAEVYHFEDLLVFQSVHQLRESGKIRLEGRDYPVEDGDVILFRHNP